MPVLGWWSAISFRWEVPLRLLGGALSLTHPRRACSGCRAGSSDSSAATANRFGHCRCCRAGSIDSSAATTNRFGHCRCCRAGSIDSSAATANRFGHAADPRALDSTKNTPMVSLDATQSRMRAPPTLYDRAMCSCSVRRVCASRVSAADQ
jgi:hypothetical protein